MVLRVYLGKRERTTEMVKSAEPWEFVSRYVGFSEGMSDGLVDDTGRVGVLEGSDTPRLLE